MWSYASSTAMQKPGGYGRFQMQLEWLIKSLGCSDQG